MSPALGFEARPRSRGNRHVRAGSRFDVDLNPFAGMSTPVAGTTNLDRYQHISALGSGGMATVVLAEDTVLGREVALKRMKVSDDERGLSRLRREALIGASVSHPNLVSIYDVVTSEDGDQVIVMEYVPGETLREALFRETKLPPAAAMRILRGVGAALDAIHRQGIVHRDVKPANILLGTDETVKLADLGIASVPDRTRITTAGALLGTFSYMAPEQLSGANATSAADVYALSVVAFEALSGRKAHTEANPVALAHAISTQPPPDLREAWPDAPPAAAEVLIRGMSKDPDARPRSASELIGRLHAALEPKTTAEHDLPPPASPRREARAEPAPERRTATPVSRRSERAAAGGARGSSAPTVKVGAAPERGGTRKRLLAAGLVSLAALAVVLAVLLSSSGSNPNGPRAASSPPRTSTSAPSAARSTSTASRQSTPAASTPSTGSSTSSGVPAAQTGAAGAGPVAAVESFYGFAASHRYPQAWALADPTFQNQLGGYQSFQASQAGDRSITFNAAHVVSQSGNSATVAVQTTSVRSNGTQHCSGTVDLTRSGASAAWALHLIHINCT